MILFSLPLYLRFTKLISWSGAKVWKTDFERDKGSPRLCEGDLWSVLCPRPISRANAPEWSPGLRLSYGRRLPHTGSCQEWERLSRAACQWAHRRTLESTHSFLSGNTPNHFCHLFISQYLVCYETYCVFQIIFQTSAESWTLFSQISASTDFKSLELTNPWQEIIKRNIGCVLNMNRCSLQVLT